MVNKVVNCVFEFKKEKNLETAWFQGFFLVAEVGLEPTTFGL